MFLKKASFSTHRSCLPAAQLSEQVVHGRLRGVVLVIFVTNFISVKMTSYKNIYKIKEVDPSELGSHAKISALRDL